MFKITAHSKGYEHCQRVTVSIHRLRSAAEKAVAKAQRGINSRVYCDLEIEECEARYAVRSPGHTL
jgi:hypothetical protein